MSCVKRVSRERVAFERSLDARQIESFVADQDLRVLQTSSPVEPATWDRLNSDLFARRDDITLRVYGFYSTVCDLSFLPRLANLQRFSADCLMQAKQVEQVASLPKLKALSLGIYDLESFDFLHNIPAGISELSLSATKSKKPSLAPWPDSNNCGDYTWKGSKGRSRLWPSLLASRILR